MCSRITTAAVTLALLGSFCDLALGQGGVIRHQQVSLTREAHFRSTSDQYSLMWEGFGVVATNTEIAPDPNDPAKSAFLLNGGVGGRDASFIFNEPVAEAWFQFEIRLTEYEGQSGFDADITRATSSTIGGESKRTYFVRVMSGGAPRGFRLRTREGNGDQVSLVSSLGGLSLSQADFITENPLPRDTWVRVWMHVRAASGPGGLGSKVAVYLDNDLDGQIDAEGEVEDVYLASDINRISLEARPEIGACRVRFRKLVIAAQHPATLQNERLTPGGDWETNLGWDTQADRPDGSDWFVPETPVFGVQTPDPGGATIRAPMVFWYDKGLYGFDSSTEADRARVRFEYAQDPTFTSGVQTSPWLSLGDPDEGVRWSADDLAPVSVYYVRGVINPDGTAGGTETTLPTSARLHTLSVSGGEPLGRFRVLAMGCTNASPHRGLYGASFSSLIDDTNAPVLHTFHTDDFNYHDNNKLDELWALDPEREHRALSMKHLDDYVWKRLARRAGFSVHAGDHVYDGGDGAWGLRNEIQFAPFTNVMDAMSATIDLFRPDEPHRPTLAQMQSVHGFAGGPWGDGLWFDDERAYSDDDVRFYYTDTRHVRFVYVDDCRWAKDDTGIDEGIGHNYEVWNDAQLAWLQEIVGESNTKAMTVLVFNFMFTYNKSADKWGTRWSINGSPFHEEFNSPERPFLLRDQKQLLIDLFLDDAGAHQRVMAISGDHHATYAVEMRDEWEDGRALLEVCSADAGSGKVKFRWREEDAQMAGTTLAAHGLVAGSVIPFVAPDEYLRGRAGAGSALDMIKYHAAQRETMFDPQHPSVADRALGYDAPMVTVGRKMFIELAFDEREDEVIVESILHWHDPDLSGGEGVVMHQTSMGVHSAAALGPGCSLADRAAPYGTVDFSDVIEFLDEFVSEGPAADLDAPFGVWDFSDVAAFLTLVSQGCP